MNLGAISVMVSLVVLGMSFPPYSWIVLAGLAWVIRRG